MAQAPEIQISEDALALAGDWTIAQVPTLLAQIERLPRTLPERLDLAQISALDPTGAQLLKRVLLRFGLDPQKVAELHLNRAFLDLALRVFAAPSEAPSASDAHGMVYTRLALIGAALDAFQINARLLLGFLGLTLSTLGRTLLNPSRLRATAMVHHMEAAGFNALPIVCLLSFLVGAVVAYLGASVLRPYGGELFTVELIAFSFMREFGVLLAAIIVAGRSGSAFTAEIGSMKSHEEIDAMRALGLDPIEILVLPRTLALVATLPLVAFLATFAGVMGGALVSWISLDIGPALFLSRLQDSMSWEHLTSGLIKAPFFALAIGLIGCLEGMKVEGSAESVGRHTTSAVVQSIFVVILLDALFAMFYLEIDF